MIVQSTNICIKPTTIKWQNRTVETGIYKQPTKMPIYLGMEHVKNDIVSDRKVHGGSYKACYIYGANHYPYWKERFPNLDWQYGMLGENLTVSNFNEKEILVGSIYQIGEALVQITQPREPCFKFGYKFGDQGVLKTFIDYGYSGTYVKVLNEGFIGVNDQMQLIETPKHKISVWQLFNLLFSKTKDQDLLKIAIENEALPISKRNKIAAFLK